MNDSTKPVHIDVPSSGEEWAEQQWSLDTFPVGCGVAVCETCNKAADQDVRKRRAFLITECLRFIEETGDGLLPYVLGEALKTHPNVETYVQHMLEFESRPGRRDTVEERQAIHQQRLRFYSLLREDFLMHVPFACHSSALSQVNTSDSTSNEGQP